MRIVIGDDSAFMKFGTGLLMIRGRGRWLGLLAGGLGVGDGMGGGVVVMGDSLSKEYSVTFLGIGGNLAAGHIRNWSEILEERRGDVFGMGSFGVFGDWRLTGHAQNWSIPGSMASEWRERLSYPGMVPAGLETQLRGGADRVVIWLGGNDVRVKYGDLYDGRPSGEWAERLVADVVAVMEFVRARNRLIPLVVCGVPHVGATPSRNEAYPYDPVKTGRATAVLDGVNLRLRRAAEGMGAGYAEVYEVTRELVTAERWVCGGWRIEKRSSSGGEPDALFLGDDFHPNWPAQAVFAQRIVDAFNQLEGGRIPRLTNREIVGDVLGQDAGLTLNQWARGYGIVDGDRGWGDDPDGDGLKNVVEFAFDLDPLRHDRDLMPVPWWDGDRLALAWQPRDQSNATWARITVQESAGGGEWKAVPSGSVINPGGGVRMVRRTGGTAGRMWLRFQVQPLP